MANWNDKVFNVKHIINELNVLPESLVFVDDNPVEQEFVRQSLPDVKVPQVRSVTDFILYIEQNGYFNSVSSTNDDKNRNAYYAADTKRNNHKAQFEQYDDFLRSLEMTSSIVAFQPVHMDRIVQLINKTNQFNITANKRTFAEIDAIMSDNNYITLFATLEDKFGSNGIVSALIGEIINDSLHIRTWVMSCRVFMRNLELAIFDWLVKRCVERRVDHIVGYYIETSKNGYVKDLYSKLEFSQSDDSTWAFEIGKNYQNKNQIIQVKGAYEL